VTTLSRPPRLPLSRRGGARVACAVLLGGCVAGADAADVAAGRGKADACVACHGDAGISVLPNAPNLAGQPAIYLADQLRQFRAGKRPSEVMAVIARPLSDADIDDLAAWYASIEIELKPRAK